MASHHRSVASTALPQPELMRRLRDPDACTAWVPVSFQATLTTTILESNTTGEVVGTLCGHRVVFELRVSRADEESLHLTATGPCRLDVRYSCPAGDDRLDVAMH